MRGTRARVEPRACKIRASARVEAEVGDEPGGSRKRNDRDRVAAVRADYRNHREAGASANRPPDPLVATSATVGDERACSQSKDLEGQQAVGRARTRRRRLE